MEYPNLTFHAHQILSALSDISNHLLYLPDRHREIISTAISELSSTIDNMVSDFDAHSGDQTLAEEYTESDQTSDVSPFDRTDTVEIFDNYIALNADGLFTYGKSAAFTIFGRSNQRLLGKNIWEAFPDLKESLLYSTFQEAVATQSPAQIEMQGIDKRWFAISIHPTKRGVIIYWLDISDKKQIENALRISEERLRAVIQTAPINVFTLDKDLRYVWIGSRRDGFFHEPLLGQRDDEFLPAQDAAVLMEAEQIVLDTGKGLRKEVTFTKNERQVIYDMAIEPLFDGSNRVVGLTIAVMDVTRQRHLEAEKQEFAAQMEMQRRLFEQSEMERAELARNLHDGPIQNIVNLGFSLQMIKEVLHEDRKDADVHLQQMGDDIKGAIGELRDFCNELRPAILSRLGLRRALLENIEDFQQKNPHIRITADFSEDLMLLSDPIALTLYRIYQHAMRNIVLHAAASEVWVRLKVDPQQNILEIQDNGKGLPGPVDWAAYALGGHLGMVGMKERAEAVGGTLQLISQPGEGTLVQVIVPQTDKH
jgi:PAS domain S-box-containing protein